MTLAFVLNGKCLSSGRNSPITGLDVSLLVQWYMFLKLLVRFYCCMHEILLAFWHMAPHLVRETHYLIQTVSLVDGVNRLTLLGLRILPLTVRCWQPLQSSQWSFYSFVSCLAPQNFMGSLKPKNFSVEHPQLAFFSPSPPQSLLPMKLAEFSPLIVPCL